MKTIAEQAIARRLGTVVPELTRLRGYSESEGVALLADVLSLSSADQSNLADHFQTELAVWRRACGQPVPFSQPPAMPAI